MAALSLTSLKDSIPPTGIAVGFIPPSTKEVDMTIMVTNQQVLALEVPAIQQSLSHIPLPNITTVQAQISDQPAITRRYFRVARGHKIFNPDIWESDDMDFQSTSSNDDSEVSPFEPLPPQ
jgi:hypothetical protein